MHELRLTHETDIARRKAAADVHKEASEEVAKDMIESMEEETKRQLVEYEKHVKQLQVRTRLELKLGIERDGKFAHALRLTRV